MAHEDRSPFEERDSSEDRVPRDVDATASSAHEMPARVCIACGRTADYAHLNDDGSFDAWYCAECDHERRRRTLGWRRRMKQRLRRAVFR